ncbi:MAG TPA: glycosyl hydrolase family 65 protein [Acidimicrobiales bacterium]|jgi:alpha,alpha-trehalose phosphorylase|nr:glycosyl hydrolase family 65 protein [Acidimicrobiales bacterium]
MIEHPEFGLEPWCLTEVGLHLGLLAQTESVFALSNGHIGLRGNLDEGDPHGLPGTYLGSFYEQRPLPSAESAYGVAESSQTVVNVTNGKLIRLLVDDEPFDVRYGRLAAHRRTLDMRGGTLEREAEWESPGRRTVRVRTTRLVSLVQRAIAAVSYEVQAVSHEVRLVIQSELVANEELPVAHGDPRQAAILGHCLQSERYRTEDHRALLIHRTKNSGLRVAAMMEHEVLEAPDDIEVRTEVWPDAARSSVILTLAPGQKLRFVKYLAYGWSAERSLPALEDQVAGAIYAATHTGFDGLLGDQRSYLDDFWDRADVEVDGDDEVQQAVRFAMFHVLQAGARAETRAIAAKGLTGPGYDGHAFWDSETFVLPVLTYTAPEAAADALRWRHATLALAQDRAAQLGLQGASFPWRTIAGEECSGYWPASTAAFHINADIADATLRYLDATGDEAFADEVAVALLVATARLWCSLGHFDDGRGFRIDGVTGPDEYSAVADNNIYTNLMAQRNLLGAAAIAEAHQARSAELGVGKDEVAAWRRAGAAMAFPYDEALGVHPQADGFIRHQRWDFESTGKDEYPLLLHFPYFDLYRKQVVKQADVVLAIHLRGDAFSAEDKARDFAYYEALTVRDSSLSACTQAVVAAEVGHLDLAYDYLGEAALMDIQDLEHNTRDGLHIASLAGTWIALVAGLGGMRDHGERLSFAPRLPDGITRLRFRLLWRGARLAVEVRPREATYSLAGSGGVGPGGVEVGHFGERFTLGAGESVTLPLPPAPSAPAGGDGGVSQPPGRAPRRRGPERAGGGGGVDRESPGDARVDEWGEESFPASDPPGT